MENMAMSSPFLNFYKGKRVLVTGHTGFKGAWLSLILQQYGATVMGYALEPEYDGLFVIARKSGLLNGTIGDIRDKEKLAAVIRSFRPEFIFHLAAQPLVRRSYRIPAETFETNVLGTARLLESLQSLEDRCTVVVITTDKVYENNETGQLFKETDRLGGFDPYSASKACTEIVVSSFRNSFFPVGSVSSHGKALTSARAGNVIGGGDWSEDRIIPDIVRALQQGDPIAVRSPGSIRPWQHVLEPLSGYLSLAMRLDQDPAGFSIPFNFGPLPDDHLSVKELVETAIQCWGSGIWKDISDSTQPHEAGQLNLDISRALQLLQWRPRFDAKLAIQKTIEWYRQPADNKIRFTFEQINDFFET